MLRVPIAKLLHRVGVALAAEMFERVGRRDGAELRALLERFAESHPLHQPSAERIADTRRIDDPMRHDGPDVSTSESRIPSPGSRLLIDRAAVFAAGDQQRRGQAQHAILSKAGLLANELELVVVRDDGPRAGDAVAELVA